MTTNHGQGAGSDRGRQRLIYINWPSLWCGVFFAIGFVVGRLW